MKKIFLLFLSISLVLPLSAQNETDALRHTQTGLVGTARSLGMGGAFSTVGADITAGALNPAGFGLYRSSKFTISPAFRLNDTEASFLGENGQANKTHFRVNNWGYVANKRLYYDNGRERKEVERGLKAWTFAIGQHQLENYHRTSTASGFNPSSSISQSFAQNANGLFPTQLGEFSNELFAFDLLVIDTIENRDGRTYFPAATNGNVQQTIQRLEEGRRNEFFISLAGNFEDRLYIGGTLGIQRLEYTQRFTLSEQDINNLYEFYDPNPDNGFPLEIPMEEIRFSEWFGTNGTGINAKLGIIFRPSDPLRLGISIQSPTYFALTDTFNSQLVHVINTDVGTEEFASPSLTPGRFNYNLTTPFRINAGFMYLFGKSGFISGDLEFIDYAGSNLSTSAPLGTNEYYSFENENQNIENLYSSAVNLRIGGEYRVDIFRLRAGYAYYGNHLSEAGQVYQDFNNPENLLNLDASRNFITLGVGIRQPNYFLDVAYVNQRYQDKFSPYSLDDPNLLSPTIVNSSQMHYTMLTFGFNF